MIECKMNYKGKYDNIIKFCFYSLPAQFFIVNAMRVFLTKYNFLMKYIAWPKVGAPFKTTI